jgi:hypothetical protein
MCDVVDNPKSDSERSVWQAWYLVLLHLLWFNCCDCWKLWWVVLYSL